MANTWLEVAPQLDSGNHVYDLCVYKGKLYGTYDGTNTRLVEWDEAGAWIKKAGTGDVMSLIVFDGKLWAGPDNNGKFYYWNDINAWMEDADKGQFYTMEMVEYHGQLYASTRIGSFEGGCLWRRNSPGNWTKVASRYDVNTQYIYSLCIHDDRIFAGAGEYGRLLEWNHGDTAWTLVADANAQGLGNVYINALLSYEGWILAVGGGINTGFLWKWDEAGSWIPLVTTPPPTITEMHDLLVYRDMVFGVCHSGVPSPRHLLVMWDGKSSWIPLTTNSIDLSSDAIAVFNDKIYAGTYDKGKLVVWESAATLKPTNLLCCDKASSIDPDGDCVPAIIDTMVPYFSAIFNHPHRHAVADHYRIQVNTQYNLAGTLMWNSGMSPMPNVTQGNRCSNLYYGGALLSINVTYYWRIMFFDDDGNPTPWSDVNCFRIEEVVPPDPPPPKYKLRIGKNIIMCEADKQDMFEMHFTLRQNGGCCEFNLSLKAPKFVVNLGDQVCIYLFGSAAPWYIGRVLERDRPGSSSRVRKYSGYGHFEFLNGGVLVNRNYNAATPPQNMKLIVQDILANNVRVTGCLISVSNTLIQDTAGYTVTDLHFDRVKPIDALTELLELAQNYEMGVTEAGDFYFRSISTNITERKWVGKHLASYLPKEDMRKVINYWELEGGLLAAGSNYDSVAQDPASILMWGQRSGKATVPDGFNTLETARWGQDLLTRTKDPIIKAVITGIDIEQTQTRIWPRGQMRVTSEDGTDVQDFPMKTVTYHITPAGITADVELGEKITSTRDFIRANEKKLHEEREQLAHDVEQLAAGTSFEPMSLVYLALFKDEL